MNMNLVSAIIAICCIVIWTAVICLAHVNRRIIRSIDQYRKEIDECERRAERAYTTNMLTKKPFFRVVSEALKREDEDIRAFVALDGDGFSKLHRRFGPTATGLFVQAIAGEMKHFFPENDLNILCNAGAKSDEFMMMLSGRTSETELRTELESFRKRVSEIVVEYDGRKVTGTVSIGAVLLPICSPNIDELYTAACRAQKNSKQAGGNRVTIETFK